MPTLACTLCGYTPSCIPLISLCPVLKQQIDHFGIPTTRCQN